MRLFCNGCGMSKDGEDISDTLGCTSCAMLLPLAHFNVVYDLFQKSSFLWPISDMFSRTSLSRELHQQRFSDCSVARNLHSGFLLLLQASLWPPKLGFRLYRK